MDVLKIGVRQSRIFRVDKQDYSLTFTVPVIATLEVAIGRQMKSAVDWWKIQTKEVPAILEAGFTHYHPNEAKAIAESICNALEPEEIATVIDAVMWAACPRAMARWTEQMEKAQERLKKGLEPFPNVQGADAR